MKKRRIKLLNRLWTNGRFIDSGSWMPALIVLISDKVESEHHRAKTSFFPAVSTKDKELAIHQVNLL